MKRLAITVSLSAWMLMSSGCCVRGLCMRGGPCNLRLPNPLAGHRGLFHGHGQAVAPPAAVAPVYAAPMAPAGVPCQSCPPPSFEPACGNAVYEPACGNAMYAPYEDVYESTSIPSAPIIETTPAEGIPMPSGSAPTIVTPPSSPSTAPFPSSSSEGSLRPSIQGGSSTSTTLPQPPALGLVQGPEMGGTPEE